VQLICINIDRETQSGSSTHFILYKNKKIMISKAQRYMASVAAAIAVNLVLQPVRANDTPTQPLIINAGAIFDGTTFIEGNNAILVQNGKIKQIAPAGSIVLSNARVVNVPGGSILPGFIDMHTHHLINGVPPRRMLEHGITTARDLGSAEPITPALTNQTYQLRQFFSGPILQAQKVVNGAVQLGYPNVVFPGSGVVVNSPKEARHKVDSLVKQGASVIAVSLEEGGEFGAPWGWHVPSAPWPWVTLTDDELNAIVDQAHNKHHVRVTAYLGNSVSAMRALKAGVDEWAHSPCDTLDPEVIALAGAKGIAIDGTIDTEIKCTGALDNAAAMVAAGAKLFYSTDMGHPDIPHGIDAQEIHMGLHVGFDQGQDYPTALTHALKSATSEAGEYLRHDTLGHIIKSVPANLGQIIEGAPADILVIGTDVRATFKELEFPRLVVKDGRVVIERAQGE